MATASALMAATQGTISDGAPQQGVIVIEPLFEYPSAPEDLEGLQERSDYLMDHFWDKMDFKKKQAVDQNALNDAFYTYSTPMRFADASKVDASIAKLLSNISKNPVLSLQFAKAAEETLYGPRADYWNDEIYLRFVDNVLSNKGIKPERKKRFEDIKRRLTNSKVGALPAEFDYMTAEGKISHYHPNGVITIIEFGSPENSDSRLSKLKMETNVAFSSLVEKGKINVLFIITEPKEGWQQELKSYPSNWYTGASAQAAELFDLRTIPSIYVIDREGKIAVKHIGIETAMQIAAAAAQQ